MKTDLPELLFPTRRDFRKWLQENSETSGGVWLVFGKKNSGVVTLSQAEALEEALCFGWIDGQFGKGDDTKFFKYFAKRRRQSPWSEKNKKLVGELIEKGLMATPGLAAVEEGKKSGKWDLVNEVNVEAFAKKLADFHPAYENYMKLSEYRRIIEARRYYSFKTEAARERDFLKIVDMLNNLSKEKNEQNG